MQPLKYLKGYPEQLVSQIDNLITECKLTELLQKKYPKLHEIRTNKGLYDYTIGLKNTFMQKSQPLSKVIYDPKIKMKNQALGLHTFVSRVQGKKLKSKNEIRIASTFKTAPEAFLRMIVVHELAHLKEKDHNKAFFKLCKYMEPAYHQLEFDMRLYLTHLELIGPVY